MTNCKITDGGGSAVLRTVLEHEIGHLSGFEHSSSSPVMSSNYNPRSDPSLLSDSDLINLKRTYGKHQLGFLPYDLISLSLL